MRATLVAALLALAVLAATAPGAGARTVPGEIQRMAAAGSIDAQTAASWRRIYADAASLSRRLPGARRVALAGAVRAAVDVADAGALDVSTARPLFLTLRRNREYWATSRPRLANGARIMFPGSQLVWQHYVGEGLQIQWLGTFGRANALWQSEQDEELKVLLDEALVLASRRAGGIAWEYLFRFDRGRPPWVSALAQGTGIQALSRGAVRLREPAYFAAARAGLGVFKTAPPQGVRARTQAGSHYLLYSFWPQLRVLNGFVQAVNGLWDFSVLANDQEGRRLFDAGEAQLRRELPGFDTGSWSRYSNFRDSDLGYHTLVRDFLRGLCTRMTAARDPAAGASSAATPDPAAYCTRAGRFTDYLGQPPRLAVVTRTLREGRTAPLRFTLSKPAAVTVTLRRGGGVVLRRTLRLDSGRRSVTVQPSSAAPLAVSLTATDLAGNRGSGGGQVRVLAAR